MAHHAVTGCNMNVGDMFASGTISGPNPDVICFYLEFGLYVGND